MTDTRTIAIDFDNTIVAYDEAFVALACARSLVRPCYNGTKSSVRAAVRALDDGESLWQALQAEVYGVGIDRAAPFAGVLDFVIHARAGGAQVAIVSHKSRFAAANPHGADLHVAALRWLHANAFIGTGLIRATDVYFEPTRAAKIARIGALGADVAIDDLREVLIDPTFPPSIRRWHFLPGGRCERGGAIEVFPTWYDMRDELT